MQCIDIIERSRPLLTVWMNSFLPTLHPQHQNLHNHNHLSYSHHGLGVRDYVLHADMLSSFAGTATHTKNSSWIGRDPRVPIRVSYNPLLHNCAATTRKPETLTLTPRPRPRPTMLEKGAGLNKVNSHDLPPLTDMTGWCEVRSANKEEIRRQEE